MEKLAELGHECTGIDFSKNSISFAKKTAKENDLSNQTINRVNFYLDKINEIELSLEDKSNPHKGINIEKLKIKIK